MCDKCKQRRRKNTVWIICENPRHKQRQPRPKNKPSRG